MNAQIRTLRAIAAGYEARSAARYASGSHDLATELQEHAAVHRMAADNLETEHREFMASMRTRMNERTARIGTALPEEN